ncbi:MAG: hypothetical protein M3Y37_02770, partial [Chloroflexota bacterium]|nr:hypothetical protein [Chloroflexota bacterium]
AQTTFASVRTGGGIAGGGWLNFGPSEAQFSVFGSRFTQDDSDEPIIVGSLVWVDAAGFSLRSTRIDDYGPDPNEETARIMTGAVEHSQTLRRHSFWLRLNDLGGPGDEADTIEFIVGPEIPEGATAATPEIGLEAMVNVSGTITVGDLQLLTFDFEQE